MEVTLKVPVQPVQSSNRPPAAAGTTAAAAEGTEAAEETSPRTITTPASGDAVVAHFNSSEAAGSTAMQKLADEAEETSPRTITTPASGDAVVAHFNSSEAAGSTAMQKLADEMLPQSHTCFFQVDLPPYSSYGVLRRKLLYAVTEGIAIDADNTADAANWEFEGD
ncbi:uncharacterized protein EMH_0091810 [Eimeria mitis]|uniref:HECT domain-containing protein n=1 Tax=Eimeria mitis TaxID=44415 RepID=U6KEH1_9EIME|nr:uncharacterized protein EMH_0091810 [Eimeria mitis]CDJ34662.1 hypothetical protein, conserved [Eimeria mitis]